MKKISMLLAALVIVTGCAGTARTNMDYCGTFEGVLPAASGPGIKTTIELDRDYNYIQEEVYIGEPDGIFNNQGTYSVSGNIIKLKPINGEVSYYQVEKDQIRRLDMMRRPVTGALANNYILKKTACCR